MPYRLLLDTSSLMYRTFFAFPPLIADQAAKEVGLRECQQKCAVKVSPTVVTNHLKRNVDCQTGVGTSTPVFVMPIYDKLGSD